MAIFHGDDSILEYTVAGEGTAVVFHHGLVGSAGVSPQWQAIAAAAGIQLIAVARPGYGESTPVEMASIGQWADLVTPLLDSLGIDRFATAGISAGGPYALALASQLPHRVVATALLSGLGLVGERETRVGYGAESVEAFEYFAQVSLNEVRTYWRGMLRDGLAALDDMHPWRAALISSLAHEAAGPGREAWLQQRPWGFPLSKIAVPVASWHAIADSDVPIEAARIIARRIDATMHETNDPEHVPSDATVSEAFSWLARWSRSSSAEGADL